MLLALIDAPVVRMRAPLRHETGSHRIEFALTHSRDFKRVDYSKTVVQPHELRSEVARVAFAGLLHLQIPPSLLLLKLAAEVLVPSRSIKPSVQNIRAFLQQRLSEVVSSKKMAEVDSHGLVQNRTDQVRPAKRLMNSI